MPHLSTYVIFKEHLLSFFPQTTPEDLDCLASQGATLWEENYGAANLGEAQALPDGLLDDTIHDLVEGQGAQRANDASYSEDQDRILDAASSWASQINNDGPVAQLAFLLGSVGEERGVAMFKEAREGVAPQAEGMKP